MEAELNQLKLQKIQELHEIESQILELKKKQEENNLLKLSIKELNQKINDSRVIIEKNRQEHNHLKSENSRLENSLRDTNNQYDMLIKNISEIETINESIESGIASNKVKILELEAKKNGLQAKKDGLQAKNTEILSLKSELEYEITQNEKEFTEQQTELDAEINILNQKILELRTRNFSRFNELQIKYKDFYSIPKNNNVLAHFKSIEYDLALIINRNIVNYSNIVLNSDKYYDNGNQNPWNILLTWQRYICPNIGPIGTPRMYIQNEMCGYIKANYKNIISKYRPFNNIIDYIINQTTYEELKNYFKDSDYFKNTCPWIDTTMLVRIDNCIDLIFINFIYFLIKDGKCDKSIFEDKSIFKK
jgi:predicted nuclease with TOPRIM domain